MNNTHRFRNCKINYSNFTFKLYPWPHPHSYSNRLKSVNSTYPKCLCERNSQIQTTHWLICIHTDHTENYQRCYLPKDKKGMFKRWDKLALEETQSYCRGNKSVFRLFALALCAENMEIVILQKTRKQYLTPKRNQVLIMGPWRKILHTKQRNLQLQKLFQFGWSIISILVQPSRSVNGQLRYSLELSPYNCTTVQD